MVVLFAAVAGACTVSGTWSAGPEHPERRGSIGMSLPADVADVAVPSSTAPAPVVPPEPAPSGGTIPSTTAAPTTSPAGPPGTVTPGTVAAPTSVAAPTTGQSSAMGGVVIGPRAARIAESLSTLRTEASRAIASEAIDLVSYDWMVRLGGWRVRFLEGRTGVRGLTLPDQQVIEVYVRPSDDGPTLAHVFAHELGHAADVEFGSDASRAAWLDVRGHGPGTIWFPATAAADFATGAGDFAESFAWIHGPDGAWFGELGPPPNATQAAVMARIVGAG